MSTECKKVKFINEQTALFYIKKLKDTSVRIKKPVRSYLCEKCLCWHLTSREDRDVLIQKRIENYQLQIREKNKLITELNNKIHELKNK